jgi:hypothetical protein
VEEDTQGSPSLEAPPANKDEVGGSSSSDNVQGSHVAGTAHTGILNGDEEDLGPAHTGISIDNRTSHGDQVFVVGWAGPDDSLKPHNWPLTRRVGATLQISLIALVLTATSAIDAAVLPQAAKDLGVSQVAESLATGKEAPLLPPFSFGTAS